LEFEYKSNVLLAKYTTMNVGGRARYFVSVNDEEHLKLAVEWARRHDIPILVLGGGSNLVISSEGFDGLVVKVDFKGIESERISDNQVVVDVRAGEVWDEFVEHCVSKGWWGVENMSLIPGSVGAVAVQNVGAYGQEARSIINHVRAYDIEEAKYVDLDAAECKFKFRESIFNTTGAGRYVITSITFQLLSMGKPNLSRPEVVRALSKAGVQKGQPVSQRNVRDAIITLRSSGRLLPVPGTYGNSGTFFRAGVVDNSELAKIVFRCVFSLNILLALKIIGCRWKYPTQNGFKLPSRILIEACRLGGAKVGPFSLYENNCAVLVNGDKGSSQSDSSDLLQLIRVVRQGVFKKTRILIPIEPTLVGFNSTDIYK